MMRWYVNDAVCRGDLRLIVGPTSSIRHDIVARILDKLLAYMLQNDATLTLIGLACVKRIKAYLDSSLIAQTV
jgi:hypothetical protein